MGLSVSICLFCYVTAVSEPSPLVVDTSARPLSSTQSSVGALSPLVSTTITQPSLHRTPSQPPPTTLPPFSGSHQDAFVVTSSQVPLTHTSSVSETAENPLTAAAQSPGFNQFPSAGTNLPVWMVAGGDSLGSAPGGLGSGFGNGFFSSSNNSTGGLH